MGGGGIKIEIKHFISVFLLCLAQESRHCEWISAEFSKAFRSLVSISGCVSCPPAPASVRCSIRDALAELCCEQAGK